MSYLLTYTRQRVVTSTVYQPTDKKKIEPSTAAERTNYLRDHSMYSEPVFELASERPHLDEWELAGGDATYRYADGVAGGSFLVPRNISTSLRTIIAEMRKADRHWFTEDRRLDLIAASISGHLQLVLRNLVREVKPSGRCPAYPRALAEVIVLLGHGFDIGPWEDDQLRWQAGPNAEDRYTLSTYSKCHKYIFLQHYAHLLNQKCAPRSSQPSRE